MTDISHGCIQSFEYFVLTVIIWNFSFKNKPFLLKCKKIFGKTKDRDQVESVDKLQPFYGISTTE